ncbi:MAG: zinc ribbon domain-containing protein [Pyrinomonadaceae bacterium]|nr:zinc ribbon domain-containing protein [Pyrinomonadaceae bacterium]MBP6212884.1 zinc ribbon domain-containing protein [Pyrinomonadaceae bacterium]
MFCSNCGNSVPNDLNYCNGCGKRLGGDPDKDGTPGKMLDNVLTTLFLIVMFGFGILVGLIAVLLGNEVKTEVVVVIAIAYLAAVFGICVTLVRQVPKLIDAKLNTINRPNEYSAPHQLTPRTTAQLEEFREPVMSVTDHTTKILDKVPLKSGQ